MYKMWIYSINESLFFVLDGRNIVNKDVTNLLYEI